MAQASLSRRLDVDTLHATINTVGMDRPWVWLRRGWDDYRYDFGTSIFYGGLVAFLGFLILTEVAQLPHLFTAAVSGFMLIGPLAAAGLYEVSRRREQGFHATSFTESLQGLKRNRSSLLQMGVLLLLAVLAWERLSAILFALFFPDLPVRAEHYLRDVFLSSQNWPFLIAYFGAGGVLAMVLFSLLAVSIPMLVDRDVGIVEAMIASVQAVSRNPGAMALWALILVALIAIGFATFMIGMVVVMPVAGHATWHAYRDLVQHDD